MFGRKEIREQFYRLKKKKKHYYYYCYVYCTRENVREKEAFLCGWKRTAACSKGKKKKRISSQIFPIFLFENFPNIYRTLNRGNVLKFVTFMLLSSLLRKTFALRSQTHHKLYICHSLKNKQMLIDTLILFGH